MVTKTVSLELYENTTGMYAFLYTEAGVLINSGGDALTHTINGVFTFDVAESLAAYNFVEVRIHESNTPTPENYLWQGSLSANENLCRDVYPPPAITFSVLPIEAGSITGFPSELVIGDSYDEFTGEIRVDIQDANGDPLIDLGGLAFEDAEISFVAFRSNDATILEGECTYYNTSAGDSYVLISLSATVTATAKAEYTYEGRLQFLWTYSSGTDDDVRKTYKTTPFKFVKNPI